MMAFIVSPRNSFDQRTKAKSQAPTSLKTPYHDLVAIPSTFWGTPVLKDSAGKKYCPGFIGQTFSSNPWDYVEIDYLTTLGADSDKTPGLATVSVRRGRKIDRKKSSGSDGETLTFTGINNADIEISLLIWTPEQLDALIKMWSFLQPAAGKGAPGAFDVHHPQFTINGVKSCVFVDSVGMEPGPTGKTKVFVIKAIEYFPPGTKKTTHTIKKSQARNNTLSNEENSQPGKNEKAVGPR